MKTCEKCGHEMHMYYKPWCPVCDKPQRKNIPVLNFIQCLEHIEVTNHRPGYKKRMWEIMLEEISNDSIIPWFYNEDDDLKLTPGEVEDIKLFNKTFNITPDDNIYLEISW